MKSILQTFQKKLTNLNANNKSLLALRTFDSDIDLHRFDFAKNKKSFSIIEQLLLQQPSIALCDYDDARSETVNELSKKVKKVHRINQIIFDERGTKDLYVGWPFVHGMFANGTAVRCPLLFFPVNLSIQVNTWVLKPKEDVEVIFNKSFLLAYAHHHSKQLDMTLYDATLCAEPTDSLAFRTQLYELLKASNVEINFNQALFQDQLEAFKIVKRKDFESTCELGILKLFPEAVLGQFPQAGNFMSPDYDYMIAQDEFATMEDLFLEKSNLILENNSVKEEKIFSPFPIDAWQEDALVATKNGKSIAVQGPPGTGKSQLISNLVSDFIARGKNVLVVCQKRAALEVVHQRLSSLQLQPFVGVVHDYKNDRKKIFAQLHEQIEQVSEYKKTNSTLDTIVLERKFSSISKRIDDIVVQLSAYKKALFENVIFGKSIKELYLTTTPSSTVVIDLSVEYKYFTAEILEDSQRKWKQYFLYQKTFVGFEKLLKEKINFKDFNSHDALKMGECIGQLRPRFEEIIAPIQSYFDKEITYDLFQYWKSVEVDLDSLIAIVQEENNQKIIKHLISKNHDEHWAIGQWQHLKHIWENEAFFLHKFSKEIVVEQLKLTQLALEKHSNKFHWLRWKLFSNGYKEVKKLLQLLQLHPNEEGLRHYKNILLLRLQNIEYLERLSSELWQFPGSQELNDYAKYFHIYISNIQALATLKDLPYMPSKVFIDINTCSELLVEIKNTFHTWSHHEAYVSKYISTAHITKILAEENFGTQLQAMVSAHFETLVAYDVCYDVMSKEEQAVTHQLQKYINQYSLEALISLVQNNIQQLWITHIETLFPILKIASNGILEQLENELQECILEKTQLCQNIVQTRAREHTYLDLQYNRLNNLITYRDLKHQVSKKKNVWSLRQVLQAHGEEVCKLVPCWLASPESVSAVFDITQKFDLVIFDEASQCYAEQAIPAIYRAKQIVIAGDAMQLPPSDLYQVRWENEEDDVADVQVQSLLSLAERYLEPHILQGHYRSLSKGLIDFSNHHFYKGKLNFLPHHNAFLSTIPAIDFIKIEGLWIQGVNKIEAEQVAKKVLQIMEAFPHKSIGVICFNFTQSQLVLDYLDVYCKQEKIELPADLFVKNIENVQGDERDIIILSVGYAPDQQGRVHTQFGSLNTKGGEHRLNVAITRAREKIVVLSSIYASQLEVKNTMHEGPKLLQKYLQYAEAIATNKPTPLPILRPTFQSSWYLSHRIEKLAIERQWQLHKNDFAELTILGNQTQMHLVHTDDEGYYAASNIKEYHAYKPLEAKSKHWNSVQVWSRNYYTNQYKNLLAQYFNKS